MGDVGKKRGREKGAAVAVGGAGAGSAVAAQRERLVAALPGASQAVLAGIIEKLLEKDDNIAVVADMIAKAPKEKKMHCVLCHNDFRPSRNGPASCIIEHSGKDDEDDDSEVDLHSDRECFCGDEDCFPSGCNICDAVCCEIKGWHRRPVCYRGPHLTDADPDELGFDYSGMADRSDDCNTCEEKLQARGLAAFLSGPRIFSSTR